MAEHGSWWATPEMIAEYTAETNAEPTDLDIGPFDDVDDTAGEALDLAVNLATSRPAEWQQLDDQAMWHIDLLSSGFDNLSPHPVTWTNAWFEQQGGHFGTARHHLRLLWTALPFSPSERRWFSKEEVWPEFDFTKSREAQLPDLRPTVEGEILDAGVRRVVHGRDLMRRWVSWRQGRDEFAGQGSLVVAIGAAAKVGELLIPRGSLPDDYLEQRDRIRALIDGQPR